MLAQFLTIVVYTKNNNNTDELLRVEDEFARISATAIVKVNVFFNFLS